MKIEHTPGPWKAYELPQKIGYATHEIHFNDDGECVAEIVHGEANAQLIAAAPDLLEALIRLIEAKNYKDELGKDSDYELMKENALRSAKEAIKKATGDL